MGGGGARLDRAAVGEIVEDPYPHYRRWQDESPVWRVPGTDAFFVTTWALVNEAVTRTEDFSNHIRRVLYTTDTGELDVLDVPEGFVFDVLGAADPPDHAVHRKLVLPPLGQRRVETLEPLVGRLATDLLADAEGASRFELTGALANPLPMRVIADVIGFADADADVDQLARWAFASTRPGAGTTTLADMLEVATEVATLGPFLVAQLERALPAPADDLLGAVAGAVADGVLAKAAALSLLGVLLSAGGETTTSLIGNSVRILAERPDLQDRLRADPDLVVPYVEEVLRLESPFRFHPRVATRDTRLGGVDIPERALVALMWGAVNRDPALWDEPDVLRLDREHGKSHMAFGRGIHFCVGAPLARLETRVVLTELLARTKSFALDPADPPRWLSSLWFRRHAHLPLTATWKST